MKKRLFVLISLFIIVAMCTLTFLACNDNEEEDPNGGSGNADTSHSIGLAFKLDGTTDTYILTGIGDCTDKDIVIPPTYNGKEVSSIRDAAFSGCASIESVTMPNSIIKIGYHAFDNCNNLASITVSSSITEIEDSVFAHCAIKAFTIPEGVTSIDSGAFSLCDKLESITIPNGVTLIDHYALFCPSLTSITYLGTIEEWNSITKNSNWDYGTSHYTVHCTDGDVESNE